MKNGFGAKHSVRRILGTVVEIGIDYFATNPRVPTERDVDRAEDVARSGTGVKKVTGDLKAAR